MSRERFRIGFLARCAEQGLTGPQIRARLKQAHALLDELEATPKQAADDPFTAFTEALLGAAKWTIPAAAVLPLVGGFGTGYGIGRLTDVGDIDVEEAKRREKIDELQRLAAKARHNRALLLARKQQTPASRPLF